MKSIWLLVAALSISSSAWAGVGEDVLRLRHEWEHVKYEVPASAQAAGFEKLAQAAQRVAAQYPRSAEAAIWHGIIEASYAGAKGGLGALSLAKSARKSFEHALSID